MNKNADNQEVYQDCTEETGAVLVVEILEYQHSVTNDVAPNFFWMDLADSNGVPMDQRHNNLENSEVINLLDDEEDVKKQRRHEILPNFSIPSSLLRKNNATSSINNLHNVCCLTTGIQNVVQGKEGHETAAAAQCIHIEMCILRLTVVETDLLITLSVPTTTATTSRSSNNEQEATTKNMDIDEGGNGNTTTFGGTIGDKQYSNVFQQILKSFQIKDWSLFG
mmetsp:Transcript_14222/g.24305  ORF Transcript_14222/g.24305 Transcript_14222/m.24305 type:complete len:223 (-) Transcript_14222:105-773(-)